MRNMHSYTSKRNKTNIIFDFAGVIVKCPDEGFVKKAFPKLSVWFLQDCVSLRNLQKPQVDFNIIRNCTPLSYITKQLLCFLRCCFTFSECGGGPNSLPGYWGNDSFGLLSILFWEKILFSSALIVGKALLVF